MRCQAKSKRSQQQCKSWAVKGKKVCRMHGAFGGRKIITGEYTRIKQAQRKEERSKFKEWVDSVEGIN